MSNHTQQSQTLDSMATQMDVVEPLRVQVPELLKHRALDDYGLPIPSTVYVDPEVGPSNNFWSMVDFDAIDWNRWAACVNDRRCGYCSHPHEYYMYFVGRAQEIYDKVFANVPFHHECLHYLLQIYPAVYLPRMRDRSKYDGGELPIRLGVYKTRTYKIIQPQFHVIEAGETKLNYRLVAGSQVNQTMWVEYNRDAMNERHTNEYIQLKARGLL